MTALKKLSEEELVQSLKANQRQAYDYLYDNYAGALMGIITRIVKTAKNQKICFRMYFSKSGKKSMTMTLQKVACLPGWSTSPYMPSMPTEKTKMCLEDIDTKINTIDTTFVADSVNYNFDVKAITENLKSDRKVLIDMVYFQGYTQEEAVGILQIPLGTAKSRIRTALQDLKSLF